MNPRLALLVLLSVTLTLALKKSDSPKIKKADDCTSYPCLVFDENFNDLDLDVWEHEITMGGGGNWEFQYYTNNRSNSYTRGGTLYIKPTLTSDKYGEGFVESGTINLWGSTPASVCTGNAYYGCERVGNPTNVLNPVQSARLRSVHSFDIKYGRIEVMAKMPVGDWIWPAIWMMATREPYGGWPASGEIDLVESRGNRFLTDTQGAHKGCNAAGQTMHWGPYFPYNGYDRTTGERQANYGDAFHRYQAEWDANSIRLSIDDVVVVNVNPPAGGFWELGNFGLPPESNPWRYARNQRMAPFDQPFYFILNVAVGGTNGYFPDNWVNVPYAKPWSNPTGTAFRDFWNARGNWHPTWNPTGNNGEDAALQIQYIRAWKLQPDP